MRYTEVSNHIGGKTYTDKVYLFGLFDFLFRKIWYVQDSVQYTVSIRYEGLELTTIPIADPAELFHNQSAQLDYIDLFFAHLITVAVESRHKIAQKLP
jgi:hypothetical protein